MLQRHSLFIYSGVVGTFILCYHWQFDEEAKYRGVSEDFDNKVDPKTDCCKDKGSLGSFEPQRNAETRMQAGDTEMRFGRCPYCRAMIRQNPSAAVYYCSKCRTPIRGKNTEPAGEATDDALSRLEILSADGTASVFSDDPDASSSTQASVIDVDGDQPPFSSGYNSCSNSDAAPNIHDNTAVAVPSPSKNGEQQDEGGSVNHHVNELRPSSRRTRRASSASDSGVLRRGDFSVSKELGTSVSMSGVGLEASNVGVATSPLTDPAFHRDRKSVV